MWQKSARGAARGVQQFGQGTKTFPTHMAQLLAVSFLHRFIETGEKPKALRRDSDHHHSAVFGLAAAGDQVPLLQAVEKPSDVRIPGDHATGDFAAGKALRRASENTQDVVLVGREVVSLQHHVQASGQDVGGAKQIEEHCLLGAVRQSFVLRRPLHPLLQ